MPIIFDDFSDRELLTAAKLNAQFANLESKFSGGVTQADMAWPFAVGGNIDMRFFGLLNIPRFWKAYNLVDRDTGSGVTVQNVYDAIGSEGGGVVVISPDSVVSMDAITIPSNVSTVGYGITSVAAIVSAPSRTHMIQPANGALNVGFYNLQMSGAAAASNQAVQVRSAIGVEFQRVDFRDWGAQAVELTNAGVDGVASTKVSFSHCTWDNGGRAASQAHILLSDCDTVRVSDCTFGVAHNGCIVALATNNTRLIREVQIANCHFKMTAANLTNNAITFDKTTATLNALQGGLQVVDCDFDGNGESSECSIDIQDWQDFQIRGCTFHDCTSNVPAIRARNCSNFKIDVEVYRWTIGDGIVIGTQGYAEATFGVRVDTPCFDFQVKALMYNVGRAGLIWTGGSQRYDINHVRVSDCSQQTTATFYGLEFWFTTTSTNTDGSLISNNSSRNVTAGAPDQAGGLQTYSGGGNGGGASPINVGGVGESNVRVTDNCLPGMAAGTHFAATAGNHTFANNVN